MAVIDDCSPANALDLYHERAYANALAQLDDELAKATPAIEAADAALTDLNDSLSKLLAAGGVSVDPSCTLPSAPTLADIEKMIPASSGLCVVNGRVFLKGDLSLAAARRLYEVFGSVDDIYKLIPEMFAHTIDPEFHVGETTPSRVLVITLKHLTNIQHPNPCNPDDTVVSESETVSGIDTPLPEADDTRRVIVVWIGDTTLTSGIRNHLVKLNFTDQEIVDVALLRSREGMEVYSIPDPKRLGKFLMGLATGDYHDDTVAATLLANGLVSVNDSATISNIVDAVRNTVTTPPSTTCGISPAIALMATLDYGAHVPDVSACGERNIYEAVNRVFGAMGVIQRAIQKALTAIQKKLMLVCAKISDFANKVDKYLVNAATATLATGNGLYGVHLQAIPSVQTPGIPQVPGSIEVATYDVTAFGQKLGDYLTILEEFADVGGQSMLGFSIMLCSASAFGKNVQFHVPAIPGAKTIAHTFRKCPNQTLNAQMDLSGVSFDCVNEVIQQLLDLINRLRSIADILQQQQAMAGVATVRCSLTETSQLAVDLGKRLAAQSFGRF